jgi:CRISPR type III-A-associated RAMP protein Csm4
MNPGLVIKLRPTGPWRIGPDSGARNQVDAIYHSDSLYSAVTSAMERLGLLEAWLDATARTGSPAVSFSSCFPFLDEIGYVVPPRTIWPPSSPALLSARVRWKSARFVPLGIVPSLLAGQSLDEKQWAVDGLSGCLVPAGRPGPFRIGVRYNAAVDRLTGAAERHSIACLEFRPGAGLWTLASFANTGARDRWQDHLKAAFRLLADSGFGGERSRGWGRSETPEFAEGMLPDMILGKGAEAAPAATSPDEHPAPATPPPAQPMQVASPDAQPEDAASASEIAPRLTEPLEVPAPSEPIQRWETESPAAAATESLTEETAPPAEAPELSVAEQVWETESPAPEPDLLPPPIDEEQPPAESEIFAPQAPSQPAAPEPELPVPVEAAPPAPGPWPIGPEMVSAPVPEPAAATSGSAGPVTPHWLLSLFAPSSEDSVDWRRGNYTVLARGGRVESPTRSGELKKQLQMVSEGSVLYATSALRGSAPDVAPDNFAHPVFRAGFAVSVPLPEVG